MASATYRVTGMTCGHCVRAVSAELTGLGGVTGVSVDLVPGGTSAVTPARLVSSVVTARMQCSHDMPVTW